ncbi:MAG TPA: hypothetical protein VF897_24400 [Roseiflexaceae bacterium]
MALRKLLTGQLPEEPTTTPGVQGVVEQALDTSQLAPLRIFLDSFSDLRPWWPVIVPLLLWYFWHTYRRERSRILKSAAESS